MLYVNSYLTSLILNRIVANQFELKGAQIAFDYLTFFNRNAVIDGRFALSDFQHASAVVLVWHYFHLNTGITVLDSVKLATNIINVCGVIETFENPLTIIAITLLKHSYYIAKA